VYPASVTFPEGGLPAWAEVGVEPEGLRIVLKDGRENRLPFAEMVAEIGGMDANVILCRSRTEGFAVQCSAPGFADELRAHGGESLREAFAAMDRKVGSHRRARLAGGVVAALLVLGAVLLFWFTPQILAASATGLPMAVDETLGDAAMDDLEPTLGPRITDPVVQGYLDQVIARLRPHASEPDVDFRIRAVDSEEVNAFALPGGQMVVMGGLLEAAEGPEEVAGVLAHEMAHVTERHGLKGAAHGAGRWLALSLLIGDDSAWVALAGQAADVASGSAYSREQEAAADAEGARLMAAAGLDPTALARFFERLKQEPGSELTGMASWISSHPEHDERIAHVRELAATLPTAPHRPLNVDWAAVRAAAAQ